MTDLAAIKERYDDIIRRLDAPKMGNPKYLTDRVQIEGELRSLTRKLLALLADTPSVEPKENIVQALPFPTTDASKWVAVFRETFPDANVDDGSMLGWFANAIEHGRGPDTPSVEPLDVERLVRALEFAHPGPRPWPGGLSSAEFARVVAGAYEHGYEASDLPCTFHRPSDDSMCGKPEVDPIHPGPHERMGRGRHVYRHDPAKRSLAPIPTQASDSPEKTT